MYRFNEQKDKKSKSFYKKITIKMGFIALFSIVFLDIMIGIFYFILSKCTEEGIIHMMPIVFIGEIIVFIPFMVKYAEDVTEKYNNASEEDSYVDIDDEGILYIHGDYKHKIKWQGIKKVDVRKDYIAISPNDFGVEGFVISLFNLDGEKEEIVKDIEKYKKVRRF